MKDAISAIEHGWLAMRGASRTMLAMRALLGLACVLCLVCCGLANLWTWLLLLTAIGSVIFPDTVMPGIFLGGTVLVWMFVGRHSWPTTAVFVASVALVHWSAIMCSRGPIQAEVRASAFSSRSWLVWAGASVVAIAAVLGVDAAAAHLPGGRIVADTCAAVAFVVLIAFARFGRVDG